MTDDIRALTARLADEPGSLAFLELAEALRRRGQLDAAYKVARGGLTRYPGLADAHDLMARVLSDQGDLAGAFDAWSSVLQLDPMRTSALKGLAFLYYRAGHRDSAIEHLQRALDVDPDDRSIAPTLARIVREPAADSSAQAAAALAATTPTPPPSPSPSEPGQPASRMPGQAAAPSPFDGIEGGERGLLLVDTNGLRLSGRIDGTDGADAGDRVAAQLAGVSREAGRATRLLGLGSWQVIAMESPDGHLVLAAPTAETVLLAARDASLPVGRVALLAEWAARSARVWLERP